MDTQWNMDQVYQKREFLEQVKKITKRYDISQVNELLYRGWRILAIEQQDIEPNITTTYFILGHVEENAM